jgi:beta-lactamase class A
MWFLPAVRYSQSMRLGFRIPVALALAAAASCPAQPAKGTEDAQLDQKLLAIAAVHHGHVALFAENLKTGQTASLAPDMPVKTASIIKLGILLDAAEQIRAGTAKLDERLVLTSTNQVGGSGVLGELTAPIALTLGDVLTLMIVLSDNTATNMAIDRLGLDHIDATLRASGLHDTWLYKKVFVPASGPMPADQAQFGLGKTTPREAAAIMARLATCHLAFDRSEPLSTDGPICGAMLTMLRHQQDRNGLPRFIENSDTSEHGPAIANKTGALNNVRNDVALILSRDGPIVIAAFTFDNADERWSADNEGELTLAKLGEAVVERWAPDRLDPQAIHWENPLVQAGAAR